MNRRKVYHVRQKVVEFYEHTRLHGWRNVPKEQAGDWPSGTYSYVELIHTLELNKEGLFGSHAKW